MNSMAASRGCIVSDGSQHWASSPAAAPQPRALLSGNVSSSVWQNYSANTFHIGLITH